MKTKNFKWGFSAAGQPYHTPLVNALSPTDMNTSHPHRGPQSSEALRLSDNFLYQQIWKTQQWPQDWKRSVFIPITKKGNAKECSNYRTVALISHASKYSKFSKPGFSNM